VNYDAANWMALIGQLDESHTDVHVLNRAQLIDDAFALARAGHVNYTVPLRLTKYLAKENDTAPWRTAMKGFAYLLERMPRDQRGYADLKVTARRLDRSVRVRLTQTVLFPVARASRTTSASWPGPYTRSSSCSCRPATPSTAC